MSMNFRLNLVNWIRCFQSISLCPLSHECTLVPFTSPRRPSPGASCATLHTQPQGTLHSPGWVAAVIKTKQI